MFAALCGTLQAIRSTVAAFQTASTRVCVSRINGAEFLQAGSALQSYLCMTESISPVVWTGDLKKKKIIIVTFWFQGLFQCHNGKIGIVWSYIGISAGWLQCPGACLQCLVVCGLAQEELSGFGVSLFIRIKRCFAFFWRYIYIADVLDHNIYVMEKHANWSLTHVKVRCCCSIKKRQIWVLDRIVPMNAWDFSMVICKIPIWVAPAVGLQTCLHTLLQSFRSSSLPPASREESLGMLLSCSGSLPRAVWVRTLKASTDM